MKRFVWSIAALAGLTLGALAGRAFAEPQSAPKDHSRAQTATLVGDAVYRPDTGADVQLVRGPYGHHRHHGHWRGHYGYRPYRSFYYGGYYPYYGYSYPYYSYSYPYYGYYGYGYPYATARPYWRHGGVGVWW